MTYYGPDIGFMTGMGNLNAHQDLSPPTNPICITANFCCKASAIDSESLPLPGRLHTLFGCTLSVSILLIALCLAYSTLSVYIDQLQVF